MKRQFLITKFVCSSCGSNLEVSYDRPKNAGQHALGEPTGAAMVESLIAIAPCQPCMEPLRKLKAALAVIR